jgi:7-cyano-7-deazaguanine synthase
MAGATWKEVTLPIFDEIGTMLTQSSGAPVTQAVDFYTRGLVFKSVAARYVEAIKADALVVGYTAEDNLPESHAEQVGYIESAIAVALQRPFKIEAPLLNMTKREIVALARTLPGCWDALRHSVSCFAGTRCGGCKACLLRAKGFREAGMEDPAA